MSEFEVVSDWDVEIKTNNDDCPFMGLNGRLGVRHAWCGDSCKECTPDNCERKPKNKLNMETAIKGAIAALTQNATHQADVDAAVKWLTEAIENSQDEPITSNRLLEAGYVPRTSLWNFAQYYLSAGSVTILVEEDKLNCKIKCGIEIDGYAVEMPGVTTTGHLRELCRFCASREAIDQSK